MKPPQCNAVSGQVMQTIIANLQVCSSVRGRESVALLDITVHCLPFAVHLLPGSSCRPGLIFTTRKYFLNFVKFQKISIMNEIVQNIEPCRQVLRVRVETPARNSSLSIQKLITQKTVKLEKVRIFQTLTHPPLYSCIYGRFWKVGRSPLSHPPTHQRVGNFSHSLMTASPSNCAQFSAPVSVPVRRGLTFVGLCVCVCSLTTDFLQSQYPTRNMTGTSQPAGNICYICTVCSFIHRFAFLNVDTS